MVLVNASTHLSHMRLLSTSCLSILVAQINKLRDHHPDYLIKSIRLDKLENLHRKLSMDIACRLGFEIEYPIPHVHTRNGLVEAFIKRL